MSKTVTLQLPTATSIHAIVTLKLSDNHPAKSVDKAQV